ncbi:glycosyltransferase family 4 protein [Patescibacteria group bacterium]|nr:glycosyltransferase family 4 protein [Patescibacteria group bacterium]
MKKLPKIGLISLHSFLRPGGVKSHILGLRKEFKRRRYRLKIIVPRRAIEENYGKEVILLGTSFSLPFGGGRSDFAMNFNPLAIENTLREEKFDILHFHNFSFPSSFQILERSQALNILTFHSDIGRSEFLKEFPIFLYILKKIVQWKIDGIIGVSPIALNVFKKCSPLKTVIPNGVDLEKFNPRVPKIKKFSDGKINILFVGRIEERKGLIYLIKAYQILTKKFPNLRLIIIGDGELKADCQSFVKNHDLKEVYFEGEKTGKNLVSYFTTSDIFCAPSIYGESFGIVLLEGMACKLPVVAFANRGYKALLKGKRNEKFLARPRSYKDLAKKLEILIKNKNLREEIGRWGRKEAKKYSWSKVADQVLDFYQICQKNKQKRLKESFSVEEMFEEVANKDILDWLR